ncbi:MAG: hypothetical protein NVS4B8_28780 [Herpetosiphon sp.]
MLHYRLHRDPRSSHQQILRLLQRLGSTPILDVGAAQGFLGQLLHGGALEIDAIEPNLAWADHARPFYRSVWATGVEEAPLPSHSYRAIVLADVLEHTADPVGVLRRLREAATPDAQFIISLPNVAHGAVRLMLLFGAFPRMERGILDRTHLHFYTRRTAAEMLSEAGLVVRRVRPTGFPLDEIWRSGEGSLLYTLLMRLQHALLLVAPTFFAWQWVIVATPAE